MRMYEGDSQHNKEMTENSASPCVLSDLHLSFIFCHSLTRIIHKSIIMLYKCLIIRVL